MNRVTFDKVSVNYPIFSASSRSFKNAIASLGTGGRILGDKAGHASVLALDEVSFTLRDGDRVALIGHNGSGKSTMLRVMAGIYRPSSGNVVTHGRIGALFDQGYGLDMEATGYENIFLRGLALGMSKQEIEARYDEITEFSELGSFMNLPLRTYSVGMAARLAFGVTTAVSADVLLMDEGIGAGDAAFVEKANKRMMKMVENAGTLVLGSHSALLIRQLCNRALLMQHGRLILDGPVDEVLSSYTMAVQQYQISTAQTLHAAE